MEELMGSGRAASSLNISWTIPRGFVKALPSSPHSPGTEVWDRSSAQHLAHHACEQSSTPLLAPLRADSCPMGTAVRSLPWGGILCHRGAHWGCWGRRAPSAACSHRHPPASTAPGAVGWAKRAPWMESFHLFCRARFFHRERAPALQTCTTCVRKMEKVLSGLDSKFTDTQNTQNGGESACHGPLCICLTKTLPWKVEKNPLATATV